MNNAFAVSVSQVNRFISLLLKKEEKLSDIYIKGEISNFIHHKSGHMYFTLKDENSSLKSVMFKGNTNSLKFIPEDGLMVLARGSIQVYEASGQYQLYCTEMEPAGLGQLYLAYEQLKLKLEAEGLFSQKRPIPQMPSEICIITAETGAAFQDMLNILSRRFPIATVRFIPALVQGINASKSLVKALEMAQESNCDVIIIGRGGGSYEDLWCFNDENVARALFASKIPTISAVGHETDFVITDFVADLRAPTPSAAAELCTPDIDVIYHDLNQLKSGILNHVQTKLERLLKQLENYISIINANSPKQRLLDHEKRLDEILSVLNLSVNSAFKFEENRLNRLIDVALALNPLNVLKKGYTITEKNNSPIKSIREIDINDIIEINFNDGKVKAKVVEMQKEGKNEL